MAGAGSADRATIGPPTPDTKRTQDECRGQQRAVALLFQGRVSEGVSHNSPAATVHTYRVHYRMIYTVTGTMLEN